MTTTGAFTSYALTTSGAYALDITKGPDGNLWFTQASQSAPGAIGRITPSGAITLFSLASSVTPLSITAGPDGALWFTMIEGAAETGKIGRITTSGELSYFRPPDHSLLPKDITTGPDNALWFTQMGAAGGATPKIGRVTTAGAFNEFPIAFDDLYRGDLDYNRPG